MKNIDFTQPGGFPLTQDQLGYLQAAYTECIAALASAGGSGPYIITGCEVTRALVSGTTYNYSIAAGWIFYQGNMIKIQAGGLLSVNESVDAVYMQVTSSLTPLTYNDGSTPNVVLDSYASLMVQPIGTADDATHFLLSEVEHTGFMPLPSYLLVNTAPNGHTVTFTHPQTIEYNNFALPGINTIILDSTNGREGCEVVLYIVNNSAGSTIAFSTVGIYEQTFVLTGTPSLTTPSFPSAPLIIKIKAFNVGIITRYLVEAYYNH